MVAGSGTLRARRMVAMSAESMVAMKVAESVSLLVAQTADWMVVDWAVEWDSWKVATTDACWVVRRVVSTVVWTGNQMAVQMVPEMVQWSVGCWDDWRAAGMAHLKADWTAAATEAQSAGESV